MDRLSLQGGEIGTLRQAHGSQPEFGPAPIKIDQVVWSDLPALLAFAPFAISLGCAHTERLMQALVTGGVKKV